MERLGADSTGSHRGENATEWLFLAMSHQRLGHTDEARTWLNKARDWIAELAVVNPEVADVDPGDPAIERLQLEILLREAQALIER